MSRRIALVTLLVLLGSMVLAEVPFSWDWSGSLSTTMEALEDTYFGAVTMDDRADLQIELRHGIWSGWLDYRFGGEMSYYSRDGFPNDIVLDPVLGSIELVLPLGGENQGQFRAELGRQTFTAPSTTQLNDQADGLNLEFIFPRWSIAAATGYFGWQDAATSALIYSAAEVADGTSYFAPNRLFATLAPQGTPLSSEFVAVHLGLYGGALFDLRPTVSERYNSWYSELTVEVDLLSDFDLDMWGAVGAEFEASAAWAAGYVFEWRPEFLSESYLSTSFSYSQGADGSTPAYVPWSSRSVGTWFRTGATGLIIPDLKLLWSPFADQEILSLQPLGLGVQATAFLAAGADRTAIAGITPGDSGYYGMELEGSLELTVRNDLDVYLSLGGFYDGEGVPDSFSSFRIALNF